MVGHLAFVLMWTNVYPWVFSRERADQRARCIVRGQTQLSRGCRQLKCLLVMINVTVHRIAGTNTTRSRVFVRSYELSASSRLSRKIYPKISSNVVELMPDGQ